MLQNWILFYKNTAIVFIECIQQYRKISLTFLNLFNYRGVWVTACE